MTKSKRLKPIIKIAEEREQQAVREYLEVQKLHRERETRLTELVNYKEEYQSKFLATDSESRSVFQFNDYRAFLQRLDFTIGEQKKLVLASENELQIKREAWLKMREKAQALEKAADRFLSEELALQNKKEQKETDERAQRLAATRVDDDYS